MSTNAALNPAPRTVLQGFLGFFSFSFTALGGINDLSSNFVDFVFGGGASLTLSASTPLAGNVTFTSDLIPGSRLADPRAIPFGFANVTAQGSICGVPLYGFTASVAGMASAGTVAVPEPAFLALLGIGLLGLGMARGARRAD